jgi:hypothetical protein
MCVQSLGKDADLLVAAAQSTGLPGEKNELPPVVNGEISNDHGGEGDAHLESKASVRKRRLQNVTWAALRLGATARKAADAVGAPADHDTEPGQAVERVLRLGFWWRSGGLLPSLLVDSVYAYAPHLSPR